MLNYRINTFVGIIIIALFMGTGYFFLRDRIDPLIFTLVNNIRPCSFPITYSIDILDPRFNISKNEFEDVIAMAQSAWGASINKKLFKYSQNGQIKINLIYDYRQENTENQKKISADIGDKKDYLDKTKTNRELLIADYNKEKSTLEILEQRYKESNQTYLQELNKWNSRINISSNDYDLLEQMRTDLIKQVSKINEERVKINQIIDSINSLNSKMNGLAKNYNQKVKEYNFVGENYGEVFDEGEYLYNSGSESINIYQFKDISQLTRVLVHEFGHALGINHIKNPRAIMYYLNEDGNDSLSDDDIAEVKKICKIN